MQIDRACSNTRELGDVIDGDALITPTQQQLGCGIENALCALLPL
jgi:hypothetical protein